MSESISLISMVDDEKNEGIKAKESEENLAMKREKRKAQKENGSKNFRIGFVAKIMAMALIPFILVAVTLTAVGVNAIESGMKNEIISSLTSSAKHLEGTVNALDSGDFYLVGEENLVKGSYNFTKNTQMLDSLVDGTDIALTLFYDKTRRATTLIDKTTGERIIGSPASDDVYNKVVKGGETYISYDVVINEEKYYAYYMPMKNADGSIVGMYFAGTPVTEVEVFISQKVWTLIIYAIVVGVIAAIVISFIALQIRKALRMAAGAVSVLSSGDLNVEIDARALKRGDELGDIARGIQRLKTQLRNVISKVKESTVTLHSSGNKLSDMASNTSSTADEISRAVENISKGAITQAEEIGTASERIGEMGSVINRIVNSVGTLDVTSENMKSAGDQSAGIISELSHSNDRTMDAIARIGRQVNATNESANRISEAIEIISSIADETNLLSLNASIEAARAGEQGRGFAVVANQIQKLAEQSTESAQKITEIIQELLEDSEHTVMVMNEVQKIVNEQQSKLLQTQEQFSDVSRGIDSSRDETNGIKNQTSLCDSAREKVVDVITNLSSISQQNAASTQQTTSSMEELNATISLLVEAAGSLTQLSETLEEEIEFFRL